MLKVVPITSAFPSRGVWPNAAELQEVAASLKLRLGASGVAVALASETPHYMTCVASCGESAPPVGTQLDIHSGISGRCVREARLLHSYDTQIDPRVNRQACDALGVRSLALAPMRSQAGVVGVIEAFASAAGHFNQERLDILAESVNRISVPKEESSSHGQMERAEDSGRETGPHLVVPITLVMDRTDQSEAKNVRDKRRTETAIEVALPSFLLQTQPRESRWPVIAKVLVASLVVLSLFFFAHQLGPRPVALANNKAAPLSAQSIPSAVAESAGAPSTTAFDEQSSGVGVRQELVSEATPSVRILMAKALTGNTDAQVILADHYANGDGVSRDTVKAAVWYIVASSHGSERAKASAVAISRNLQPYEVAHVRFNLGTMFRDGIGTAPDLMTSYVWFSLASAAGDVRASGVRAALEAVMTPSEVAEGRRRAEDWLAAHRWHSPPDKQTVASNQGTKP